MKALLVCAAPVAGSAELLARLAPNADVVIAVDGGGALCREAGVRPDLLVGDFDSLQSSLVDDFAAAGVDVRRFPSEKDATDLELAIRESRRLGAEAIVVTAASAGRLDHTLGVLAALAGAADLRPHLVEPDIAGWLLAQGAREQITLAGRGAVVSVVPYGGGALVSLRGTHWPLDHVEMNADTTLGVSNVIGSAGAAVFEVHRGIAFVLSPRVDRSPASERT